MPKPPASLIIAWAVTYLYAVILWIAEIAKRELPGIYVGAPLGFWYTLVIGGLILGTAIGVYLAESLSKPQGK